MYLHFHASTGFLLNGFLNDQRYLAWALFFSVFPDIPYIIAFCLNALKKRGRGLCSEDILGYAWTLPAASWTHSLIGLSVVGLATLGYFQDAFLAVFIGYASHLLLDYPFHAPYFYYPLYPWKGWQLHSKWSYFDERYHSRAVGIGMWCLTALGFLAWGFYAQ